MLLFSQICKFAVFFISATTCLYSARLKVGSGIELDVSFQKKDSATNTVGWVRALIPHSSIIEKKNDEELHEVKLKDGSQLLGRIKRNSKGIEMVDHPYLPPGYLFKKNHIAKITRIRIKSLKTSGGLSFRGILENDEKNYVVLRTINDPFTVLKIKNEQNQRPEVSHNPGPGHPFSLAVFSGGLLTQGRLKEAIPYGISFGLDFSVSASRVFLQMFTDVLVTSLGGYYGRQGSKSLYGVNALAGTGWSLYHYRKLNVGITTLHGASLLRISTADFNGSTFTYHTRNSIDFSYSFSPVIYTVLDIHLTYLADREVPLLGIGSNLAIRYRL